jgi:mono/diheme cytochrome c family protein
VTPAAVERATRISSEEATSDEVASVLGSAQRDAVLRWIAQIVRRELRAVRSEEELEDDRR